MDKHCPVLPYFSCIMAIWLLLLFPTSIKAANSKQTYKNETDSIKKLLSVCPTDSEKIKVLSKMFWKYFEKDFEHSKYYGELIYTNFNNSKSIYVNRHINFIKGEVLKTEENYDSALVYYKRALQYSTGKNKAWTHYNIGKIDFLIGYYDTALVELRTATQLFTQKKDSVNAESARNIIVNIYECIGNYDSVFFYYNKNLGKAIKAHNKKAETKLLWEIGLVYKNQNNINKAVEYLNKALILADSTKDNVAIGYIY
jgi:tetratricopeptide (TPR) repeat protein